MRILIIEDNPQTVRFLSSGLKQAGHVIQTACDGESGLTLALHGDFDAAVLDVMLPKMDGFKVLERLRQSRLAADLPVIILSARGTPSERVQGLELGADDYLPKPFLMDELMARLNAITRRTPSIVKEAILVIDNLELDTVRRKVNCEGTPLLLTALEFRLLEYLMRNRGHIVTKAMLLSHVWDYDFEPQTNVVEARICKLREKIGECGSLIRNVKGFGYVID